MIDKLVYEEDPEIASYMEKELERQKSTIELIASENIASPAVIEAMGSHLTNKYAEGYPGKRYYGGCEYVDGVEELARTRLKKLFGAEHVNVQPHSGASANLAAYFAIIKPGDTILGMKLSHGGHLTHGSKANISGKFFNSVSYGVDKETGRIDYDEVRKLALEHKPQVIVAGASAYPRIIDFAKFREIADEVGAYFMVDMAHIAGLVAAGLHPNPVEYADIVTSTTHKTLRGPRGGIILCKEEFAKAIDKSVFPGTQGGPLMHVIAAKAICFKEALDDNFKVYQKQVIKNAQAMANALVERGFQLVSGGTDNHLMLIDLRNKHVTGKDAQAILDEIHITANKNTVPYDTEKAFVTSGIRLGTPAVTTRGMKEEDMVEIADIINEALMHPNDLEALKVRVKTLCDKYPIYEGLK